MEKAKDIQEFVTAIAQSLLSGETVYYDMNTLSYAGLSDMSYEYDDYINMEDEEFEKVGKKDLRDWQFELVKYIREALALPKHIETPPSRIQYEWMTDFTNNNVDNKRFIQAATNALNAKHPFSQFKDVLYQYNLENDWYTYQEDVCKQYISDELGIVIKADRLSN